MGAVRAGVEQIRNLGAGAEGENMEGYCYWFAPHCLLGLFSYRTQHHKPKGVPIYNGQADPYQLLIKKITNCRLAFQ